jgi:hypothetical protein
MKIHGGIRVTFLKATHTTHYAYRKLITGN